METNFGYNSSYDGGSLSLIVHLFLGVSFPSLSKPPKSDNVRVYTPDFRYYYLFFSDDFHHKLIYLDELYYSVDIIHNNGTLATDATVTTYGDGNKSVREGSFPGHADTTDLVPPPPYLPIIHASNTSDSSGSESDSSGSNEESTGEVDSKDDDLIGRCQECN